jgi:ATP-dependent Clp protease ATP-binding subunit ClpA
VFERFTERARQVVIFAQDEARSLRHNYIGTEHLLLGLLREKEGLAARVLGSLEITLEGVRSQVARIVGEGDDVTTGQIPFTPRGKKVLELGFREAESLGHNHIGTEHVLLGIVRENNGVAARILLDFGADAKKVRDEVIRMLSGPGRGPSPAQDAFFEGQSPPLAPDVMAEIARLGQEEELALARHQYERAAALRHRERRLIDAAHSLIQVWNEKNDLT